jgi:hypothetical protein
MASRGGPRVPGPDETEHELVEMRVAVASGLRTRRERARLTQTALAKRLRSSQITGGEDGGRCDPTVSLNLLFRAHLTLGAKRAEIGRYLRKGSRRYLPPEVHLQRHFIGCRPSRSLLGRSVLQPNASS